MPGVGEAKPRELLLAGNPDLKTELTIVRFPLAATPRDPQALGSLALIDYFSTPENQEPRVTQTQAVGVLSEGFAQKPATFSFSLAGTPSFNFKNGTKYLRYEFDSARCEGAQVQGLSGKVCQRSDTGEVLEVNNRHHAVISTVVAEPIDGEQVADGLLVGPDGAEVLYIVDISAPAANWTQALEQVDAIATSFAIDIQPEKK